ncbi:MAG: endonuclease III [Candidatus Heimdallarchaeota archaeon]|nr:endonuclease III [Candidatus Heimdallarchaeota archaeon]
MTHTINKIIQQLLNEYPETKVSLDYSNPFELLTATILSAQTTDKAVNQVLPNLFGKYPSPAEMSQAKPEEIVPVIKTIGLYNNKAKSLVSMSKSLIEKYNGEVPKTMKELTSLAGVGRKTANVVLGNAFNVVVGITVDTHVIRLSNRMGFVEGKNAVKIERELMKIVDKKYWVKLTTVFIDHGRKICKKNPMCNECVVEKLCNKKI